MFGLARHGSAVSVSRGGLCSGKDWLVLTRFGSLGGVWQGALRQGNAGQGKAVEVRFVMVRNGWASRGGAWYGVLGCDGAS